jgi:glycosyltransferase involved in cell wall biosynthesis
MKIYIFNNGLLTRTGRAISGSDRRALEYSRIWQGKGHAIRLFIPREGYQRYKNLKAELTITSAINPFKWGFVFTYFWRALRAIILLPGVKENALAYSTSGSIADVIPALYMRLRNKKVKWLTGVHLIIPSPFRGFRKVGTGGYTFPTLGNIYLFLVQRLILPFLSRFASLILVSNEKNKKFLIRKGISPERIMVAYGGTNFKEIEKIKSEKKYEACFLGRLHAQKGISDLLKAWEEVCSVNKEAKLLMIGELVGLKRKIKKNLLPNFVFTGFLDGEEKYRALKSAKVFLFPSTYESFGIVACEAMACGLPVVAYDLPLYKEIYPKGMVRVPVGDVAKFSRAFLDLLKDEERRRKIAREAQEVVQGYSWEKTADSILKTIASREG